MTNFFKRLKNRLFLALFLSTLFVSAQTASLLHAEIHPFHHHSAECDLLEQLAQPVQAAADAAVLPQAHGTILKIAIPVVSAPVLAVVVPYQGRAPPVSV